MDELIRLHSIADDDGFRLATADIEVCGITIPAGEGIVPLGRHANHDPAVFESPERFDLDRNNSAHAGFGFGLHLCLERQLARLNQAIAYPSLFRAVPHLRRHPSHGNLAVTGWA